VADSVVHRGSGLGSLSLLDAERPGGRASVKDPRVVKIAKDVSRGKLPFVSGASQSALET
jgi:hypothetical protein